MAGCSFLLLGFSFFSLLVAGTVTVAASSSSAEPAEGPLQGPVFIYEPPNVVDFSNSSGAAVECSAHGQPEPRATWLHSDGATPVNATANTNILRVLPDNATLVFPPFAADAYRPDVHSAVYYCRAESVLGVIVSRAVHVRAVVLQSYAAHVYDEYVITGNTAVLRCHIPSFVADYVSVAEWVGGGEEGAATSDTHHPLASSSSSSVSSSTTTTTAKWTLLPSGELYVANVSNSQDARHSFRCRTRHRLTGETQLSATAGRLVVSDSNGSVPPRMTDTRTSVTVKEKDNLVLGCAAQGHPPPTYSWSFRSESAVGHSSSGLLPLTARHSVNGGVLVIRSVHPSDAGVYTCAAANSLGSERAETLVVVQVGLSVHIDPPRQTLVPGQVAILKCVATGQPITSLRWRKNGHLLPGQKPTLSIRDGQRADVGMYQCFVSNGVDTVQSTAELRLGDSPPELLAAFDGKTLEAGAHLSIACIFAGNPPPRVTWTLDRAPLTRGHTTKRVQISSEADASGHLVARVNVSHVTVEDGGYYRCTAENKAGSATHSAAILVYGKPFIREMAPLTALTGDDLSIRCPVSGYPIQVILWEKDSVRLPTNHRQKVFHNGTLAIRNIQRNDDSGSYTCIARNQDGESARRDVSVTVLVPPKIIPFSFQDDQTREGVRASVFCSLSQGDLPLSIEWLKDGRPLVTSNQVATHSVDRFTSSLVIERLMAQHGGNYTCSAKNAAAVVNHTVRLEVKVPPRWKVQPEDENVYIGSSIQINCDAEGHPPPTVSWWKADDTASGDFGEVHHGSSIRGSLRISLASERDEAQYMCKATNGVGSGLSKVIFLDVKVPVRVVQQVQNSTGKMGEAVRLKCSFKGDLPIQVTWTSAADGNEETPLANDRYSVQDYPLVNGLDSVLKIYPSEPKDTQHFRCSAKNPFGKDSGTVHLLLQDHPEPPHNIYAAEEGSRSIKLSWSHPFDGNTPVTGYVVQYTPSGNWSQEVFNVSLSTMEKKVVIRNLQPATKYHFRLLARNSLGTSHPSIEVSAMTAEEAPGGPPRDVKVEAINSHTLRVTWQPPRKDLWNGPIQGYHVGYKLHNSSEPYTFQSVTTVDVDEPRPSKLTTLLDKLHKFKRYSVVIQAYNHHGIGPNGEEVIAMTLEDVPSSPPSSVKCSPVSSQSLHIVWDVIPPNAINGLLQGYKVLYKVTREADGAEFDEYETKITSALKTMLHGLEKFTNYTIQVLGFTHVGDGAKSHTLYCTTMEDAPGPPADIKVLASSSDAIIISWMEPLDPNGIINKYTVYIRSTGSGREETSKVSVPGNILHYEAKSLTPNWSYEFWVTASTLVGEGQSTRVVTQTAVGPLVSAKIVSFGRTFVTPWKKTIRLPCRYVGIPTINVNWTYLSHPIDSSVRMSFLQDGTLVLRDVLITDSGNYTCTVKNRLAADSITHQVVVEVPPEPPTLNVLSTTTTALHLGWDVPTRVTILQGFILSYRQEYGQWTEVSLGPITHSHTIRDLSCGTRYQVYITAHNRIGRGFPSKIATLKTEGEAPQAPPREKLITENSTYITLHLDSWLDGGCPILYFVAEYKLRESSVWMLVSNNVKPDKRTVITDLKPGKAYQLRVTAHSNAGSDHGLYDFVTAMNYIEESDKKEVAVHSALGYFSFVDITVILFAFAALVLIMALIFLGCICIKRHQNGSNEVEEKITPKYQSVNRFVTETYEKNYISEHQRNENGSVVVESGLQENVRPYATFQITKPGPEFERTPEEYYSYNTEISYNNRNDVTTNTYKPYTKAKLNMGSHNPEEMDVPDLLEHASSSSEDGSSPSLRHHRDRLEMYCNQDTTTCPSTLLRKSSMAETAFILPRRHKMEACQRLPFEGGTDRFHIYKHTDVDTNHLTTMNLY